MPDFPISALPSKTLTSDTLLLGSMPDGNGGYDSGNFDAQDISGIVVKHMAQVDYDNLSPAEKNNGTLYITDGTPPTETVTGSDVIYFSDVSDSNKPKSTVVGNIASCLNVEDISNVSLTTSDNNKLLGVSVSGSDISVGAVELDVNKGTRTFVGILGKPVNSYYRLGFNLPQAKSENITVNSVIKTGDPTELKSLFNFVSYANAGYFQLYSNSNTLTEGAYYEVNVTIS